MLEKTLLLNSWAKMGVLDIFLTFLEDNLLAFGIWKITCISLKSNLFFISLMQGISRNKYLEWVEKNRATKFTYPLCFCIQNLDKLTQSLIFMSLFHSSFQLVIWYVFIKCLLLQECSGHWVGSDEWNLFFLVEKSNITDT